MGKGVMIPDQELAMLVGLALTLAGGVILWDAYERRGRGRPFAVRLAGVL